MQYTCVCGCWLEEHLDGGMCLHTLECLCHGWEELTAVLNTLIDELLSTEQIDAIKLWIDQQSKQL